MCVLSLFHQGCVGLDTLFWEYAHFPEAIANQTPPQVVCAYLMISQTRSPASSKAVFPIDKVLPWGEGGGGVWKLLAIFGSQYIALKAVWLAGFYSSNLVTSRSFPEDRHFRQSLSLGPRVIVDGKASHKRIDPNPNSIPARANFRILGYPETMY